MSFGRSRSEFVLAKTRRFRVCKPEVPVLRPKTRRFRFWKPEVPVLLYSVPIPATVPPATPRVTTPTSAPPLKLSTTLHWPTPFWLRRSPSSRCERSQANPSAAAHRAGHPVAVSPPFFEPEPLHLTPHLHRPIPSSAEPYPGRIGPSSVDPPLPSPSKLRPSRRRPLSGRPPPDSSPW